MGNKNSKRRPRESEKGRNEAKGIDRREFEQYIQEQKKKEEEHIRTLQRQIEELEKALQKEEHAVKVKETELQQIQENQRKVERIQHTKHISSDAEKQKEIDKLREEIPNLKPGASVRHPDENIVFPPFHNIGLFGTTGIGKSSLLNSLKYALEGKLDELDREQTSTSNFQGGNTVRRLGVKVTRYLRFIDNRGVGAEDLESIEASQEIINQLEGRSTFAGIIDWKDVSGIERINVQKDQRIYCTVLVFDGRNPQAVYKVLNKLVKEIHDWQGRYPIAVITHVDVASADALENMYVVLNAAGLVDTYEVANITSGSGGRSKLSLDHQLNLLKLMKRCIKEGDSIFTLREEIEHEEMERENERKRKAEEERKENERIEREKEEEKKAAQEKEKNEREKEIEKKIDTILRSRRYEQDEMLNRENQVREEKRKALLQYELEMKRRANLRCKYCCMYVLLLFFLFITGWYITSWLTNFVFHK